MAGSIRASAAIARIVARSYPSAAHRSRAASRIPARDARGVADELVATGKTIKELRLFDRVHLDLSTLPTRFPYLLITPQYHVERILRERAERLGARFVSGAEVTGLRQDGDGVELTDRAGRTYRAGYAVGADGVRSAVRRLIGQPFPGRAIIKSIMLADVRLAEPPPDVLSVNAVGDSFAFVAPFGDGWYRIFAWNKRHQVPAYRVGRVFLAGD